MSGVSPTRTLAVTLACGLLLTGCGTEDYSRAKGSPTMSSSPSTDALPATPPDGPRLCDFLPRQTAVTLLGTDDLSTAGEVRGQGGRALVAECKARPAGAGDPLLFVHVESLQGAVRGIFERDLRSPDRHQLPDEVGLGYSWTDPAGYRATSTGPVSETWLLRGDALVQVSVWSPPEGRPAEQDTTAVAQQVVATLDLDESWTLPGRPPGR